MREGMHESAHVSISHRVGPAAPIFANAYRSFSAEPIHYFVFECRVKEHVEAQVMFGRVLSEMLTAYALHLTVKDQMLLSANLPKVQEQFYSLLEAFKKRRGGAAEVVY